MSRKDFFNGLANQVRKGSETLKLIDELSKKTMTSPSASQRTFNAMRQKEMAFAKWWEKRLNQITSRMMLGRMPTSKMQEDLEIHRKYLMGTSESYRVNSTWILQAKYFKRDKRLVLEMPKNRLGANKWYTFNNVPIWVWLFLTTQPTHAGKQWWDKGFGIQFSSNPARWIRKGGK